MIAITRTRLTRTLIRLTNLTALVLAAALAANQARADLRCDCSKVAGQCSAEVTLAGGLVTVTSDNDACSWVSYLIEGQPFATLVIGGEDRQAWPGLPLESPRIGVQQCVVCADGSAAAATPDTAAETSTEEQGAGERKKPTPIVKILPTYPRAAWVNGIEGDVLLEFTVTRNGRVSGAKILESSDPLFEGPALDAIQRFRFQPALSSGEPADKRGVRERFRFRINEGTSETTVTADGS